MSQGGDRLRKTQTVHNLEMYVGTSGWIKHFRISCTCYHFMLHMFKYCNVHHSCVSSSPERVIIHMERKRLTCWWFVMFVSRLPKQSFNYHFIYIWNSHRLNQVLFPGNYVLITHPVIDLNKVNFVLCSMVLLWPPNVKSWCDQMCLISLELQMDRGIVLHFVSHVIGTFFSFWLLLRLQLHPNELTMQTRPHLQSI